MTLTSLLRPGADVDRAFTAPDNGRWDNVVVDDEAGWSRDISIWGRLGGAI